MATAVTFKRAPTGKNVQGYLASRNTLRGACGSRRHPEWWGFNNKSEASRPSGERGLHTLVPDLYPRHN